jgi:hypothetical protein
MFKIEPQADASSPPLGFNVVWHKALRSSRLAPRQRLIKQLRTATRPGATNRSTCSKLHQLLELVLLKLLEGDMRLQKAAIRKSCVAEASSHTKANGSANGHVR